MDGFEQLGQFARDDDAARCAEGDAHVGKAVGNSVWRLKKNQCKRIGGKPRELAPALAGALRQETVEQKMWRGEPGYRQCRDRRIGARNRRHRMARGARGGDQLRAGVGNRRRAGIAHERHRFALREQRQDLRHGALLVVLVQRGEFRRDAKVVEQFHRDPRVFSGDDRDAFQYIECPQTDVAQISNRGGDYI